MTPDVGTTTGLGTSGSKPAEPQPPQGPSDLRGGGVPSLASLSSPTPRTCVATGCWGVGRSADKEYVVMDPRAYVIPESILCQILTGSMTTVTTVTAVNGSAPRPGFRGHGRYDLSEEVRSLDSTRRTGTCTEGVHGPDRADSPGLKHGSENHVGYLADPEPVQIRTGSPSRADRPSWSPSGIDPLTGWSNLPDAFCHTPRVPRRWSGGGTLTRPAPTCRGSGRTALNGRG